VGLNGIMYKKAPCVRTQQRFRNAMTLVNNTKGRTGGAAQMVELLPNPKGTFDLNIGVPFYLF
jgi:hypothetical protein